MKQIQMSDIQNWSQFCDFCDHQEMRFRKNLRPDPDCPIHFIEAKGLEVQAALNALRRKDASHAQR
jgi:hypothetical protein